MVIRTYLNIMFIHRVSILFSLLYSTIIFKVFSLRFIFFRTSFSLYKRTMRYLAVM